MKVKFVFVSFSKKKSVRKEVSGIEVLAAIELFSLIAGGKPQCIKNITLQPENEAERKEFGDILIGVKKQ